MRQIYFFPLIIELFELHGLTPMNELPGLAEIQIDDTWYLAGNGHDEATKMVKKGFMEGLILPYQFVVWRNGLVAGTFCISGGTFFCDHEDFVRAVLDHLENQKSCHKLSE
jgi:hypothetical protein